MGKDTMRELDVLGSLILIFFIVLPMYTVPRREASTPARLVSSNEEILQYAATQRTVLAELFTATWCGYCPYATQAINKLAEEYGSNKLVVLQYHPNDGVDPFGNNETNARMSYYNITAYPTMIFDGTTSTVGGWTGASDSYNATIQTELQEPNDVSISFAGSLTDFTANVTASSSIQSIPAEVRFVVYEDDIPYNAPNGETMFRFTVRTILDEQAITLIPGQTISIERAFQPQAGWNTSNLGVVTFVQRDDTHEVLQAAAFPKLTTFSFTSLATAKTVQPNQTASFGATLTNTGTLDDSYNLTLTESLPAGWTALFCNGSWCCPHSTITPIQAGASQNITIEVFTSSNSGSGNVTLAVTSQQDPTQTCSIVFDATVNPYGHDVAVLNVASKTAIGKGFACNITALIADTGAFDETLNVTVYSVCPGNQTIIGTAQDLNLSAEESLNVAFTWNTASFAYGNYTILVCAWPVPGETDTSDNNATSSVKVTIPGDLNGDFTVTREDLVLLTNAYGSKPTDSNWNPNADINGNGRVNLSDLVILTQHYGQHYP